MSCDDVAKPIFTRLSEEEVRKRLCICEDNLEVIDELYSFGQTMANEVIDRIRSIESKANFFTAYGTAIVTFLVSSASFWLKLEDQWFPWISACAGLCGLMCAYFSIRVLKLKQYEWISEDEWLKTECLSKISKLKQYRILTMWGTIQSRATIQREKARELGRAQVWLAGSVVYLVYLLFHVAIRCSFGNDFWISLWQRMIHSHLWIPSWESCGNWACTLILGLTMALIIRRVWLVRLI